MRTSSNLRRNQEGMALVFVTITLALTMTVIPSLLGFIGGAGRSAQIREDRMLQVYAADMGVENAYFEIASVDAELPHEPDDDAMVLAIEDVNGSDVAIEIYKESENPLYGDGLYKVTSTATNYRGVGATIESYVAAWDYATLLEYALISWDDIEISSNAQVEGNVALNGELDNKGSINGNVAYGVSTWPDPEVLSAHYLRQVHGSSGSSQLLVEGGNEEEIGPCRMNGSYEIKGNGTVTLQGTVYVAGDLTFNAAFGSDPELLIMLNGQTIYAEGSINLLPGCAVSGPGCIIAAGDFDFKPRIVGTDSILAMSVQGKLEAHPNGTFHGCLAGSSEIDMQPGAGVEWGESTPDLNFPTGDNVIPTVTSYLIK